MFNHRDTEVFHMYNITSIKESRWPQPSGDNILIFFKRFIISTIEFFYRWICSMIYQIFTRHCGRDIWINLDFKISKVKSYQIANRDIFLSLPVPRQKSVWSCTYVLGVSCGHVLMC